MAGAAAMQLGVAGGLLLLYLTASFGLSADADVLALNSAIFDIDAGRVVADWTTNGPGRRTHVHPLAKLALAPLGTSLRFGLGLPDLTVARWMAAIFMTLNALLIGRLALQLTGGAKVPGLVATVVCGVSFSSVLLGSIPDTASVSGLASVVPLLYLNRRWGREFDWGEAALWGAIGLLCISLTLSQGMHWVLALGVRALPMARGPGATGRALAKRLGTAVALFALATWAAAEIQAAAYPGTGRFYARKPPTRELQSFGRFESIGERPFLHTARLANHFAGVTFAAPFPGYADFVMKRWKQAYWSLSLEEASPDRWHPLQMALVGVWLLALLPAALWFARFDARFLAPALCLAGQFALHFVYGREYILYSPNWHGVVTAVLVAGAWNGLGAGRRRATVIAAAFSLALAVNSLAVMNRVYRELEGGMEQMYRDGDGRLLPAPPAGGLPG
jgi:hypothetical protein